MLQTSVSQTFKGSVIYVSTKIVLAQAI